MGLFNLFKSKEEVEKENILGEINKEIFPNGIDQVEKEARDIRELLEFKYTKDETLITYLHAAGIYHIAKDKSLDRITTSILSNPKSVVTKEDSIKIYQYIRNKFKRDNTIKSHFILAIQLKCEPENVKETYLQSLRKENFSRPNILALIDINKANCLETAPMLNMSPDETPASLLLQWTKEYLKEVEARESHEIEARDSEENEWHEILRDNEVSEQLKFLIREFLIPYNIDPLKFFTNKEATSDPFSHISYRNDKNFSKTLEKFQEDPTIKALGYPEWFYWGFPDVVMWAVEEDGNKIVRKVLAHYPERDLLQPTGNGLNVNTLKRIIDLYLVNHELECSIPVNSKLEDDLSFFDL